MKILDWMHRKLHPTTTYSRVSHTKATASELNVVDLINPSDRPLLLAGTEPDSETPLLLHVNLAGILTIGTIGHSNFLFLPHFSEEPKLELPEKEVQGTAKLPAHITLLQPAAEPFMIKREQAVPEFQVSDEKVMAEPLLKEGKGRKKRTTLADLLTTEQATKGRNQPPVTGGQVRCLPALDLKGGGKEKKKNKIKEEGGDFESSQPERPAAAGRIRRMMTRMVRKKVHPDAAATGSKTGGGCGGGGRDVA